VSFSRSDRSLLADWWFTVDRLLLTALLALLGVGLVLSLAASPAVALKKGLAAFHFVERHVAFAGAGVVVMLGVSLLSPRNIRRLSLATFLVALAAMVAVLFVGDEINGSRRWLRTAGFSVQPSEFAKPAFVVLSAWAFAESRRRPDMPALPLAMALYAVFTALLLLQPDVGQTLLVGLVWGMLFFLSGQPILWALGFALAGAIGLLATYHSFGHVKVRFDRFLNPAPGENSQTERAIQSFMEGGFLGRGPGEGTVKTVLPDAHTDFIFAVVAEEYGVIACLVLVALVAFVALRALCRLSAQTDAFTQHAVAALSALFGLQAVINMAVNVGLIPAKGMTFPFISSGGSSLLAVSFTMGMVLALTRRRPDLLRLKLPRLAATPDSRERTGRQTQ
jgi:cell division protein FtsW